MPVTPTQFRPSDVVTILLVAFTAGALVGYFDVVTHPVSSGLLTGLAVAAVVVLIARRRRRADSPDAR